MLRVVYLRNFAVLIVVALFVHHNADAGSGNRRTFPTSVEVREGEDVQVRLLKALKDEVSCYVRTPLHDNYNLKIASSEGNASYDERLFYWPADGICGFYLVNIQKQDQGWWRLTSKNDEDERVVDAVLITVLDKLEQDMMEQVELTKGLAYTLMFSDDHEYCIMRNPFDPYKVIEKGMCNVEIEKVSAVDNGNWSAVISVRGQVEEATKMISVSVFDEHLDAGYRISSDFKTLHLYCNIVSFEKTVTMCRFVKDAIDQVGLRLHEGARKGRYGYYGNGFAEGECGLTIQSPEEKDYAPWHCVLNVQGRPTFTTVIDVSKLTNQTLKTVAASHVDKSPVSRVITTVNETLTLKCFAKELISYCWFSQPDGKTFRPEPSEQLNSLSEYSNVQTSWFGNCSITIAEAKKEYNGTWICHMGPATLGVEITQKIEVRISETSLAATHKFVSTVDGGRVTLQCKTVPRAMALRYCRFYFSGGFGINIDERVTKNNFILRNNTHYWYSGVNLGIGYCGLVIERVTSLDVGNWTCAAKLELAGNNIEIYDQISLSLTKSSVADDEKSTAGATVSIIFGVIGFLLGVGLLVFVVRKKWRNREGSQQRLSSSTRSGRDVISLNTITTEAATEGAIEALDSNGSGSSNISSPSNRSSNANISSRSNNSDNSNRNIMFHGSDNVLFNHSHL